MAHQHAPVTSDYRFYISSLARSATAFVAMMRQPWDMENKVISQNEYPDSICSGRVNQYVPFGQKRIAF